MTQEKANKKTISIFILALFLLLVLTFAGYKSLAYFTDRAEFEQQTATGGVDIELDTSQISLNADVFTPGGSRDITYTIKNLGSLAVDLRENIYIKSSVPLIENNGSATFEIYRRSEVEKDVAGNWSPIDGFSYLGYRELSGDSQTLHYYLDGDNVLNGYGLTDNGREIDDFANKSSPDGSVVVNEDGNEMTRDYVLVFNKTADNRYQGAEVQLIITVEAKQRRMSHGLNPNIDGWAPIQTEVFEIGAPAVPAYE